MTGEVVLEYLLLVSRIGLHLASVTAAIIGTGVLLWAVQTKHDWPLKTALTFTAALALVLMAVGLYVFMAWRRWCC